MKYVIFSLFFIFLSSCQPPKQEKKTYVDFAGEARSEFIREMPQRYRLSPVGAGSGYFERIEDISYSFFSNTQDDIDTARKKVIELSELLLSKINQKRELRPYLCEYPFKGDDVGISIDYKYTDRDYIPDVNRLVYIRSSNGLVKFYFGDVRDRSEFDFDEPYEEAKSKVFQTTDAS